MTSIDTILSRHARSMKPGETLTLTLVKGPKSQSTDPLLARAAAAKKMPNPNQMFALDFPRVAKFVETVDRPDFAGKFKEGRLIEEDVPEVKVRAYLLCVACVWHVARAGLLVHAVLLYCWREKISYAHACCPFAIIN